MIRTDGAPTFASTDIPPAPDADTRKACHLAMERALGRILRHTGPDDEGRPTQLGAIRAEAKRALGLPGRTPPPRPAPGVRQPPSSTPRKEWA